MPKKLFDKWKALERHLDQTLGKDISTPRARRMAMLHFLVVDHGVLRILWSNLHEVVPGVWRSNQPSRARLRAYKKMGIKTVLNLRGAARRSPFLFEQEACDALDLEMINHKLSARTLPRKAYLLALLDTFETIEKPFVMHCKSGADRAGLAAALYLLHVEGASIEEAKRQLSFRYAHIRASKTGVLDHVLDSYAADCETSPMPIQMWIRKNYNRKRLQRQFEQPKRFAGKVATKSVL